MKRSEIAETKRVVEAHNLRREGMHYVLPLEEMKECGRCGKKISQGAVFHVLDELGYVAVYCSDLCYLGNYGV